MTADPRIEQIRAVLAQEWSVEAYEDFMGDQLTRIRAIVGGEPVREEPRDDWCRAEHCPHRNWRSGSAPTHKIGPGCPEPAPAPREEPPLPASETEWATRRAGLTVPAQSEEQARRRITGLEVGPFGPGVVLRREVGPWTEVQP